MVNNEVETLAKYIVESNMTYSSEVLSLMFDIVVRCGLIVTAKNDAT